MSLQYDALGRLLHTSDEPVNNDKPPLWPKAGQEFDIYVAATPWPDGDGEDDLELTLAGCSANPIEVGDVIAETLGAREIVDSEVFAGDLPDTIGLWHLRVAFVVEEVIDRETGASDNNYGFEVISKEKL